MMRQTIIAISGGALSALLMASSGPLMAGSLVPLGMIPAYLAQLPLLLVGFGLGVSASVKAGLSAVLVAVLVANVNLIYGLIFAAFVAGPAVLLASVFLTVRPAPDGTMAWMPIDQAAGLLCGLALAAIMVAVVLGAGLDGGLFGQLEGFAASIADELTTPDAGEPSALAQELADVFVALAPYAPGIVGASWLVTLATNGALAQTILRRTGHNLRPSPALTEFRVPGWLSIAWGVATLAWIALDGAAGRLGGNLALVLIVPFFFAGLAVTHALAARFKLKTFFLVGLYGSLALIGAPVVGVLIAAGLIDDVANLRRRAGGAQGRSSGRNAGDSDED